MSGTLETCPWGTASSLHGLGHRDDFSITKWGDLNRPQGAPFQYSSFNFQMIQRLGVVTKKNYLSPKTPLDLARLFFASQATRSGQPGPTPWPHIWVFANRPHKCPAERLPSSGPTLARYLPSGFSHDFLAGPAATSLCGPTVPAWLQCVWSQVLPLFGW